MSLTDMMGLNTFTASLTSASYTEYESILAFTASISGAVVGSEYRATLINASGSISIPIWHGSVQVYHSQSTDKSIYENQIPLDGNEVSHISQNKYVIYD
jgi:hypothetical protein